MKNDKYLLFVEPSANRTLQPIVDSLTKKLTASFRLAKKGIFAQDRKGEEDERWIDYMDGGCYFGTHRDPCGCISDATNYLLPNGEYTNSLAIHYVAFHRWELSPTQLDRVSKLDDGEEEPTDEELWPR